jgi:hypothetical protein
VTVGLTFSPEQPDTFAQMGAGSSTPFEQLHVNNDDIGTWHFVVVSSKNTAGF